MIFILSFIGFLALWWQPIAGALLMGFLLTYIHLNARAQIRWENLPENIKARQKADYDRAHAYKPEEDTV